MVAMAAWLLLFSDYRTYLLIFVPRIRDWVETKAQFRKQYWKHSFLFWNKRDAIRKIVFGVKQPNVLYTFRLVLIYSLNKLYTPIIILKVSRHLQSAYCALITYINSIFAHYPALSTIEPMFVFMDLFCFKL